MSVAPYIAKTLNAKKLQMDSLLALTRAINNNIKEKELFEFYELFLRNQMQIDGLLLIYNNVQWFNMWSFGIINPGPDVSDLAHQLIYYKKIIDLTESNIEALAPMRYVIPVFHKETPLAFAIITELKPDDFGTIEEKLNFIETFTNILISAIENKRLFKRQLTQEGIKKEMELAGQMQGMLLPTKFPDNNAISIDAVYLPHSEIGGDYYDYIPIDDSRVVLCMADVSGKGVAAALLMSNFQANLKAQSKQNNTLDVIIKNINEIICDITKEESFITVFVAKYNFESKRLRYVNAGHIPPLLCNEDGIIELEKGSTLIGMFNPLPELIVSEVIIEKPSMLLLFTDGLTDVENNSGEYFGNSELAVFCKNYSSLTPKDFNRRIQDKIQEYRGNKPFSDDISIMTCRLY
jgi:sigma-B regulation protein RsbU (phosphoserine phosphatase)